MSTPGNAGFPPGSFPDGSVSEVELSDSFLIARASEASSYSTDNQSVSERSIDELIALDKYLRSRKNAGNAWGRIGIAKVVPPDALGN